MLFIFNIFGFLVLRRFAWPSRPFSSSFGFVFVLDSLRCRFFQVETSHLQSSSFNMSSIGCCKLELQIRKACCRGGHTLAQLSLVPSERSEISRLILLISSKFALCRSNQFTQEQVVLSKLMSVTPRTKAGYPPQRCNMYLVDCPCFQLFSPEKCSLILVISKLGKNSVGVSRKFSFPAFLSKRPRTNF